MELSNFNINFNNRILRILIIALLIFCMVFGGFMIQYCHAELVISTSIIVAATFLVACGVIAQSDVDLYALAQDFITFLGPLAVVLNQNYKWVSGATFHITNALMEKLAEYISLKFIADVNGTATGVISVNGSGITVDGVDLSSIFISTPIDEFVKQAESSGDSSLFWQTHLINSNVLLNNKTLLNRIFKASPYDFAIVQYNNQIYRMSTSAYLQENIDIWQTDPERCIKGNAAEKWLSLGLFSSGGLLFITEDKLGNSSSSSSSLTGTILPNAGVTAKADGTYFPQTGKKALTTSVPLTYPESMTGLVTGGINGVRSDIADVGTDVGVISGTLSGLWETVKGIGTTVSTGISSIVGAIAGFFDVSEFSLDLNPFKIGLTKVFPFCIPFDMLRGIKTLASNPTAFVYDIKLDTKFFDINHTVNLAPYRVPILFFRYIVDFWFIWILISRTRDLMKW